MQYHRPRPKKQVESYLRQIPRPVPAVLAVDEVLAEVSADDRAARYQSELLDVHRDVTL